MFEMPFMGPIIVDLPGPLALSWYGASYLATFVFGLWYANRRALTQPNMGWNKEMNSDLLTYIMLGVILGGRLGYVFFYGLDNFFPVINGVEQGFDWLYPIKVWEGGMSFHGGFLGVCVAYILYARKYQLNAFTVADWVVPIVPMGITFIRGANTINAELWGRVTQSPLGVYYMDLSENAAGALVARHPSTLYEMLLEGVVLFFVLQWFIRKPRPRMAASGLFVLGYGLFRTFVEFFRQPDAQLGINGFLYGTDWLTRGMTLSVPMIMAGVIMLIIAYKTPVYDHQRLGSVAK